jgi:phage head maturation protease
MKRLDLTKQRHRSQDRIRRLYAVDLWEISVVTFPMLPQARITAVKDAGGEERRLPRALTEGARLMRS